MTLRVTPGVTPRVTPGVTPRDEIKDLTRRLSEASFLRVFDLEIGHLLNVYFSPVESAIAPIKSTV